MQQHGRHYWVAGSVERVLDPQAPNGRKGRCKWAAPLRRRPALACVKRGSLVVFVAFMFAGDGCNENEMRGTGVVLAAQGPQDPAVHVPLPEPRVSTLAVFPSTRFGRPVIAKGMGAIAIEVVAGEKCRIFRDGVPEQEVYDEIVAMAFSPDGTSLSYLGKSGGKWFAVRDGVRLGAGFHHVRPWARLARSPVGESLAFEAATERGEVVVVRDGTRVATDYDEARSPVFGPDGQSFAFAARSGASGWYVVRDGTRLAGPYASLGPAVFSPDGRSLAFKASAQGREFVVRDGARIGEEYDYVEAPVFSPNARSLGFEARRGGRRFVIRDGVRLGGEYNFVGRLFFSPDGGSLAFQAREDDYEMIVIKDGRQVGGRYFLVSHLLRFGPVGSSLAFRAQSGRKEFIIRDGAKVHEDIVHEDSTGPIAAGIVGAGPCFSPDGRSLAYGGVSGRKQLVLRDGSRVGEEYDSVSIFSFSPDSRSLVFQAGSGGEQFYVMNGVRVGGEYDTVTEATATRDGRRFVFGGLRGNTLSRVEVPW